MLYTQNRKSPYNTAKFRISGRRVGFRNVSVNQKDTDHHSGTTPEFVADLLHGVDEIAEFIGQSRNKTYYLVRVGAIPTGRLGGRLIASKARLRAHYERLTSGQAA